MPANISIECQSLTPPVRPVCPEAPVSPVEPLRPLQAVTIARIVSYSFSCLWKALRPCHALHTSGWKARA